MSDNTVLFVIVGRNEPLFEAEFHSKRGAPAATDAVTRQNYFVLHSALDLVEKAAWTTGNMYLRVVDKVRDNSYIVRSCTWFHYSPTCNQKVNQQQVSAFLTAGNIKFLLLHTGRSEDSIRNFFLDVYELYVKVCVFQFEELFFSFSPTIARPTYAVLDESILSIRHSNPIERV